MKPRFYLSAPGLVNALGANTAEIATRLFAGDSSGMLLESGWLPDVPARVGKARGAQSQSAGADIYASRNTQLLLAAFAQLEPAWQDVLHRYGPHRIAVVLGTSTSGVDAGEAALAAHAANGALPAGYDYRQQEIGTPAVFLARHLGLKGPAYTVSTACTSSAKAFSSARNLLLAGLCDAVLVGGADSLCKLTLNGFAALESISPALCNPLSRHRSGINIGEGAALFLLTREPGAIAQAPVELLGIGESSDAHHISAPHPQGLGAEAAMRAALEDAGLTPDAVSYLNLHATATPKNDEMESRAVARIFHADLPVSGTKPLTGHTLGAAGATELAFCWLSLQHGKLPPHVWDGEADPELPPLNTVAIGQHHAQSTGRVCMSNSFAFGGNNISVLIGDAR